MAKVRYPFGPADSKSLDGVGGSVAIESTKTVLKLSALTGAATVDLDIDSKEVIHGSELIIEAAQGATGRNVALGTGFHADAPDLTGVDDDIDQIECWYDADDKLFKAKTAAWVKTHDEA